MPPSPSLPAPPPAAARGGNFDASIIRGRNREEVPLQATMILYRGRGTCNDNRRCFLRSVDLCRPYLPLSRNLHCASEYARTYRIVTRTVPLVRGARVVLAFREIHPGIPVKSQRDRRKSTAPKVRNWHFSHFRDRRPWSTVCGDIRNP